MSRSEAKGASKALHKTMNDLDGLNLIDLDEVEGDTPRKRMDNAYDEIINTILSSKAAAYQVGFKSGFKYAIRLLMNGKLEVEDGDLYLHLKNRKITRTYKAKHKVGTGEYIDDDFECTIDIRKAFDEA